MSAVNEAMLRVLGGILPESTKESLVPRFCGDLTRQLTDRVTDQFLESLLWGLQAAFTLSPSYRKNIQGFEAVFVFRTKKGDVGATAVFHNGRMSRETKPRSTFDTRLSFTDAEGLRKSLLAGDEDILDTMLTNPVEVDGNLSNLYRFGFLARELTSRLGVG